MEFPEVGKNCADPTCRQLDFLPVKCDVCSKLFCSEHFRYEAHNCPGAYKKNVQVPVCPLCNTLVPGRVDELPDIRVSRHIDNDCQSDPAVTRRKEVYSNRCSVKGCKQKELIPVICDRCGQNFCLRHRHAQDHACSGGDLKKPLSQAALAALSRSKNSPSSTSTQQATSQKPATVVNKGNCQPHHPNGIRVPVESRIQGNLSEDAALAMALQASLGSPTAPVGNISSSQEQEDLLLAQAIAASEAETRHAHNQRTSRKNCLLS